MSSRRATRSRPTVASGPAVHSEMEPIPSKVSTAYGSPTAARIWNPREGQVRDLRSIVAQLAMEGDKHDFDDDEPASPENQLFQEEAAHYSDSESDSESAVSSRAASEAPSSREPALRPLSGTDFNTRLGLPQANPPLAGDSQELDDPSQSPSRSNRRGRSSAMSRSRGPGGQAQPGPSGTTGSGHHTIDTSKSYGTESAIFGSATFASSPYQSSTTTPGRAAALLSRSSGRRRRAPRPAEKTPVQEGDGRIPLPKSVQGLRGLRIPPLPSWPYDEDSPSPPRRTDPQTSTDKDQSQNAAPTTVSDSRTEKSVAGTQKPSVPKVPKERIQPRPRDLRRVVEPQISWSEYLLQPWHVISGLFQSTHEQDDGSVGSRRHRDDEVSHIGTRSRTRAGGGDRRGSGTAWSSHFQRALPKIKSAGKQLSAWARKLLGLALVAWFLSVLLAPLFGSSLTPTDGVHWYGSRDLSHNIGQFIPSALLNPLSILSEKESRRMQELLRTYNFEMAQLKAGRMLHDRSIKALQKIMPKVVRMEVDKDGNPVIAQEFWHALRDLVMKDPGIFSFDVEGKTYKIKDEAQWRAIRDRLQKEGIGQDGKSGKDVEQLVHNAVSRSWDEWLASNGQAKDAKSKGGKVDVSRDQFIKHLKTEFATHQKEVKAEIQGIQDSVDRQIKAAIKDIAKSKPDAVSAAEVKALVETMIRKKIGSAGLDAMAKGKIHANWEESLRQQVNFFSIGSHAVIDAKRTSPTWIRHPPSRVGSDPYMAWSKKLASASPAILALTEWTEQGDCWCGATRVDRDGRVDGVSLAVNLARTIVPRHVVVEHILPGATLDPGARPKDIEVYAYVQELGLRARVLDFSAAHFPMVRNVAGEDAAAPLAHDGFVKIGEFTYDSDAVHGGVHVHRLSDELVSLGVATDQILIRAVNNWGAGNHTCFYRVRLYGDLRDDV